MDDPNRRRRQNESARYQGVADPSQQRRSYGDTRGYRPAPLNTPSSAARGMGGGPGGYGYYPESTAGAFAGAPGMPQGTMGYYQSAADYGQDTRQTSFPSAQNPGASMMYSVQQTSTQGPVYDTNQTFASRQPAGLGMISDVASSYYDPTNSAAATLQHQQTATSSQSPAVYQQSPADRGASLLPSYPSSMTSVGALAAQGQSSADVSMDDQQQEYPPATSGLDEAYASYQSALRGIFQNIRDGVLAAASESLLTVSDWLLSHVSELGLTTDDRNLHSDRIKLWNDFNHAWLALLQAQKDLMGSGQQLSRSQTVISHERLKKMGDELVRLCDAIERHGLVDYQYGVWEEQIIEILEECCDLYGPDDRSGSAAAGSSSGQ